MAARVTSLILRALLAGVFLFAGVRKVWDFPHLAWATPQFFDDILNYQILPWYPAMALAVYLPWLEIVTALALFSRRWREGALIWSVALMVVFLGALSSAWWRGLDVDCGCFGRAVEKDARWIPFVRDVLLLGVAVAALAMGRREERATSE